MHRKNSLRRISWGLLLLLASCHSSGPEDNLVLIQIQDRNGLSETISNPDRLTAYGKIDFFSSQPYQKVLRVFRKEGQNRSIITTYHPNGSTWQALEAKEMRAFGRFQEWFPNGVKKVDAAIIGGNADLTPTAQKSWIFDGTANVWDEEGRLKAAILYDKGALSGASIYYYSSGAIEKVLPYTQDLLDGDAQEFWENGGIRVQTPYRNGQKEGVSNSFWPSGEIRAEEEYVQGRLQSGRYYSLAGELVSNVRNAEGFQAVFQGLRLIRLQEIRKGVVEGLVKNFDSSGELCSTFYLKNEKKQGEEIEYYPIQEASASSGRQPKISLNWDQDAIQGVVKTWYSNGQLQSQREMCRNQRNGICCCWYNDGSLMLTEEYEKDELVRGQYYRKNQSQPISIISNGNGTATIYDENGVFLRKTAYLNRKIVDTE